MIGDVGCLQVKDCIRTTPRQCGRTKMRASECGCSGPCWWFGVGVFVINLGHVIRARDTQNQTKLIECPSTKQLCEHFLDQQCGTETRVR